MREVTLVGIDLGKHSFDVHAQDRQGKSRVRELGTYGSLRGCSVMGIPTAIEHSTTDAKSVRAAWPRTGVMGDEVLD